jgi:hypothetical protein
MSDAARAQYWDGPYEGEDRWRAGRLHPGRIALIVIAFILWWPIGLAVLIYSIWSGRMDCWNDSSRYERKMARMQEKMDRMRAHMDGRGSDVRGSGGGSWWGGRREPAAGSSGNRAFDEYRAETLKRLEEEERGFRDFLERLRQAKDKAEFDQFMAERRRVAEPERPADA